MPLRILISRYVNDDLICTSVDSRGCARSMSKRAKEEMRNPTRRYAEHAVVFSEARDSADSTDKIRAFSVQQSVQAENCQEVKPLRRWGSQRRAALASASRHAFRPFVRIAVIFLRVPYLPSSQPGRENDPIFEDCRKALVDLPEVGSHGENGADLLRFHGSERKSIKLDSRHKICNFTNYELS